MARNDDRPTDVASTTDSDDQPTNYNEPAIQRAEDILPPGSIARFDRLPDDSAAAARLHIERLLSSREPPDAEAWTDVADHAPSILLAMLDEDGIRRRPAMRQRVIATLGQLDETAAIGRLGDILNSRSEDELTRTFAASALGYMRHAATVPALAEAVTDPSPMVRRQVGKALRRSGSRYAIPHLLRLADDEASSVSEVALHGLQDLGGTDNDAAEVQRSADNDVTDVAPADEY